MGTTKPWETIDYTAARSLYLKRFETHKQLRDFLDHGNVDSYIQLALAIKNPHGNFSAYEHGLGPRILASSKPDKVFLLAGQFDACKSPKEVSGAIRKANLAYLKISVGSEMAAMLCPDRFWVANRRTIWAHLVLKHGGSVSLANEELHLYAQGDLDSEMAYKIWEEIYLELGGNLAKLASLGSKEALKQNIPPGDLQYLWADAVADTLFNEFALSGWH